MSAHLRHLALFAIATLVACTANTPAATAPAAASVATTGPLKIGVLVPYTESALDSDVGASQKRAADLYLKTQGGKLAGREVQLVFNDESLLDPKIDDVRIKQFLDQDHVAILMGGASAAVSLQLRDAAEAARLVYLDTNAMANALTRAQKSRYTFRASATAWQLSEPLGEWAAKNRGADYFVAYADDAFGADSATAFAEGVAKGGGRVTGRTAVPMKSGDWPKLVAAMKAQSAKRVFAAFATDDAEGLIAAWDSAGMRAAGYSLFGPGPLTDAEVLKVAKQASTGIVTAFQWSAELPSAENRSFVDAYRAAYKDEDTGQPLAPDGYALEMWDAMRALDEALKRTNADATADVLIPALEAVSFNAPDGAFAFDKTTHNPVHDVYVREVRAGAGGLVNAVLEKIAAVRDPGQ